jgi:hypothetical protein
LSLYPPLADASYKNPAAGAQREYFEIFRPHGRFSGIILS